MDEKRMSTAERRARNGGGGMQGIPRLRRNLLGRAARIPRVVQVAAGELALFALLVIALLSWTPSPADLGRHSFDRSTILYTAGGDVITRFFEENRTWVDLEEVSPRLIEALLATEDRRFFEHSGIDVHRSVGAVFQTLTGDTQGGSTLTMQLARNAFPEMKQDPMLIRKVKEWVTALRIEWAHPKEDILEMYLNSVPFVFQAYGVEAAAQTYFNTSAAELGTLESATLVAMLKGPSSYNPVLHPERSLQRRNVVLANMVEADYLTADEMRDLSARPTPLEFRPTSSANNIAPHFAEYVRRRLERWAETSGYNLYTSGLRVYTTLDGELQSAAKSAFDRTMDDLQAVVDVSWSEADVPYFSQSAEAYDAYRQRVEAFDYFWDAHPEVLDRVIRQSDRYARLVGAGHSEQEAMNRLRSDAAFADSVKSAASLLQGGFVAMDPSDGRVKAWVGGRDFSRNQYDHVAQARRQPGSTFKPFVYGAALEAGYTPHDAMPDWQFSYVNSSTGQTWRPGNFGGATGSMLPLRYALAYSKNTITAQLVMRLGAERVADFARRAGIRSELEPVPSIGLGTSPVSLLEMTAAYSTFANLGRYQEPVAIERIENEDGDVIAEFESESRQAVPEEVAYGVLDMMRGVVDRGTGIRIRTQYGAQGDLAGKTGTTQQAADGWFMLLHPNLIMGSWVGFDVQELTFRTTWWGQGAHTALHTVGRFVNAIELQERRFDEPAALQDGASLDGLLRARADGDMHDGFIPRPVDADWSVAGYDGDAPAGYSYTNWMNYRERKTSRVQEYLERLRRAQN